MRFHPIGGSLKTTKTDKKHGSRQESHPLLDRPAIDWPCRTEYHATISFGLLSEPENCQYGKSRLRRTSGHVASKKPLCLSRHDLTTHE